MLKRPHQKSIVDIARLKTQKYSDKVGPRLMRQLYWTQGNGGGRVGETTISPPRRSV